MIEGLYFDVKSEELASILQKRIDQAQKKADVYNDQAKKQALLTKELGEEDVDMPKHSGDQSSNLEKKAQEYLQRVKEYSFLKDHLVQDSYRLSRNDLHYLGIIKNLYY